jgi:hypothetical protein
MVEDFRYVTFLKPLNSVVQPWLDLDEGKVLFICFLSSSFSVVACSFPSCMIQLLAV